METVNWWMLSSPFDGFVGAPAGPPEWPFPGGQFRQPGKLTEAVELLRATWGRLAHEKKRPVKAAAE